MSFKERVKIGIEYSRYIKRNDINIPLKVRKRRQLFIRWYFDRYGHKRFKDMYHELANEVLWIEDITLESLIFNEK